MKKTLFYLLFLVSLLVVSCKEESSVNIIRDNYVDVVFSADVSTPNVTKATLIPNDAETAFVAAWETTDKMDIVYSCLCYEPELEIDDEVVATWNGNYFSMSLPEHTADWSYKATYPLKSETGEVDFGSSREQVGNNYNCKYDLMTGYLEEENCLPGKDLDGNPVSIPMTRETAIQYFHFTSSNSEEIESATLTVTGGCIATEYAYFSDGEFAPVTEGEAALTSITITFPTSAPSASDFKLWFNVLPTEYESMSLEVTTATKTFTICKEKEGLYVPGMLFKVVKENIEWDEKEIESEVEHTITWADASDWTTDGDVFSLTTQPYGYSVVLRKNNGSTAPTVNATDKDCRLYAKGTATISNDKDITKIVFNISTQGKKRLAPITASVGNIATQASEDDKVVWTGRAKEVTFTVGDNANYGSDGSSKAGQLDFRSIDATYLDDGTPDPEPEKPAEYNISIDDKINGGKVSADKEKAVAGAQITLSYEESDGYMFDTWNVTNASSEPITVTDNKFTMPAADVNVSATFKAIPTRPNNEIFYESFDTNDGTGGNDDQWSGSIATNNIKQDNEGWTFENGSGAKECAKFGAGSKLGTATTPALGVACNATLTFKAAAWNGNKENTTLKISVIGSGFVSPATVTMVKGAWNTFTATLTGLAADSKVRFEGYSASDSRFFLDEISIVKTGELTPIFTVTVDSNISNGSVTVSSTSAVEGTTVTLEATPATGYEFGSWDVTNASTNAKITVNNNQFTMPNANVNVSAIFNKTQGGDTSGKEYLDAETSFTSNSLVSGWSTNGTFNNSYYKMSEGQYAQATSAALFDGQVLSTDMIINVACGTFGTWSGDKTITLVATFYDSSNTELSSQTYTTGTLNSTQSTYRGEFTLSKPSDPSKIAYMRIIFNTLNVGDTGRLAGVKLSYSTEPRQ